MIVHLTISLIISFLVLGTVTAQTRYCCTPPQWESAYDLLTGGLNQGKTYFVQNHQNVSVDQKAHMVASSMKLISNGVTTELKLIQDFDRGKQYTITNGVCQSSPLAAWTPICVPDGAKLLTKTYFGTGDKKIDFDVYMFTNGANTYYVDIASSDCIPLYVTGSGSPNNVSAFTIGTYSNMTLGINDPTVFTIPDSCKKPFRTHIEAGRLHTFF